MLCLLRGRDVACRSAQLRTPEQFEAWLVRARAEAARHMLCGKRKDNEQNPAPCFGLPGEGDGALRLWLGSEAGNGWISPTNDFPTPGVSCLNAEDIRQLYDTCRSMIAYERRIGDFIRRTTGAPRFGEARAESLHCGDGTDSRS